MGPRTSIMPYAMLIFVNTISPGGSNYILKFGWSLLGSYPSGTGLVQQVQSLNNCDGTG